jgi:hypothetical protein
MAGEEAGTAAVDILAAAVISADISEADTATLAIPAAETQAADGLPGMAWAASSAGCMAAREAGPVGAFGPARRRRRFIRRPA